MTIAGRRSAVRAPSRAPVDDDALGDAGRLVERLRHRLAFDQILELDRARDLGQDRTGVGIPFGDALAALHLVALVDLDVRTVRDAVHGALGAVLIDDRDRDVTRHGDQLAVRVARHVLVLDLDRAFVVRLDERLLVDLRRAADVERTHRELRARLADRLRRDDADRFADVDRRAAREIAPVALAADAVGRLAGQHRTDAHLLHAGRARSPRLPAPSISVPRLTMTSCRDGSRDVLGRGAAEDARAERGDDLTRRR